MPQVLLLIAAGAALVVAGTRWYREEKWRIQTELREAEKAMAQREREGVVPLERDPATGIYRPKRVTHGAQDTCH